jgi:excisionase family DNA binding protein
MRQGSSGRDLTLLTLQDAANRLAISARHLRRLLERRGLEHEVVHLGRAVRLPAALVSRLAHGSSRKAASGRGERAGKGRHAGDLPQPAVVEVTP